MKIFLHTPSKAWQLMILGIFLWFIEPFREMLTYHTIVQRGLCPSQRDIGIEFFAVFCINIILSPVFLLFLWMALRKYPGALPLFLWRKERLSTSWLWTLFAACGIFICAHDMTRDVYLFIPPYGLYELFWIYFVLYMRVVLISKAPSNISQNN